MLTKARTTWMLARTAMAAKHVGEHHRAMFGENVWPIFDVLTAL